MNELEIERLISEGKFKEALILLQSALEHHEYLNKESLLMNIAVCQLQLNEFEKARKTLIQILELSPDNTSALFNLAYANYSLAFYQEAVEIYQKLIEIEGISEDIAYHIGMCYLYLGETEFARNSFEILIRSGKNIDLVYRIGITMISSGYPGEAIWIFTRFLETKPNDIDATFGLGIAYIETRDYLHGIECFRRVLGWNSDRYQSAYVMLGMAYFQVGKLKQAMSYLKKSLKLYPESLETWFYLGVVYESTGQIERALEAYERASQIEPKSSEIWERIGNVYLTLKRYGEAISNFVSAYQLTADSVYSNKIGLTYMLKGDYQNALEYFLLGLDSTEELTDLYENIGICYYHLGKYEEAIEFLGRVFAQNRDKDILYFIQGSSYMKLGKNKEAREFLSRGLKTNPSDINLLYSMGLLEANEENYDAANRFLDKALIIQRTPEIIYALALTKMKLGEVESAVSLFEEYRLYHRTEPDILYKLGLLYTQLHKFDKARDAFEEVLSVRPQDKKAMQYLEDLDRL